MKLKYINTVPAGTKTNKRAVIEICGNKACKYAFPAGKIDQSCQALQSRNIMMLNDRGRKLLVTLSSSTEVYTIFLRILLRMTASKTLCYLT